MKYVYLLRSGSLNHSTKQYGFYNDELFTSEKKAVERVTSGIECNKGTDLVMDLEMDFERIGNFYDYNCLSVDKTPMQMRCVVQKIKLQ